MFGKMWRQQKCGDTHIMALASENANSAKCIHVGEVHATAMQLMRTEMRLCSVAVWFKVAADDDDAAPVPVEGKL